MSIQVMVLSLDGYDDWNVNDTEHIEVEEFNEEQILNTYFDGEKEAKKYCTIRTPNPSTISFMGEEGGYFFIKMS